jgi:DNA-binding winged helix-turn-helix (wHTH) protein
MQGTPGGVCSRQGFIAVVWPHVVFENAAAISM